MDNINPHDAEDFLPKIKQDQWKPNKHKINDPLKSVTKSDKDELIDIRNAKQVNNENRLYHCS